MLRFLFPKPKEKERCSVNKT